VVVLNVLLQIWGGVFFLLNKIFLSFSERSEGDENKRWRVRSWVVYLVGLPAWVLIFVLERNWIVACLETSGVPAMVLGLKIAMQGKGKELKWLDRLAVIGILVGLVLSWYDLGGITKWTQWLEMGVSLGYLVGTYQLAKERPTGFLWFLLMNGSNAALMWAQGYHWLFWQQVASLIFVFDAYFAWRRKHALANVQS
jgi:hypothetical protein